MQKIYIPVFLILNVKMKITLLAPISNNNLLVNNLVAGRELPEVEKRMARAIRGNSVIMPAHLYNSIARHSYLGSVMELGKTRVMAISPIKRERMLLGAYTFPDLESAVNSVNEKAGDIYVMGDSCLLGEAMNIANYIELAKARRFAHGTDYLPSFNEGWERAHQEKHSDYIFERYQRVKSEGLEEEVSA